MTPDRLTVEQFAPCVEEAFTLEVDSATIDLVLTEAAALSPAAPAQAWRPFSLVFRGPLEPRLDQGTYPVSHPSVGRVPIFIVPIGMDRDGVRYEAIFG